MQKLLQVKESDNECEHCRSESKRRNAIHGVKNWLRKYRVRGRDSKKTEEPTKEIHADEGCYSKDVRHKHWHSRKSDERGILRQGGISNLKKIRYHAINEFDRLDVRPCCTGGITNSLGSVGITTKPQKKGGTGDGGGSLSQAENCIQVK